MDNNEITVTEALNHIQSWLNAGEYEKVIQGCKEILELEPSNQRALALMKKAEQSKAEQGGAVQGGTEKAGACCSQEFSQSENSSPISDPLKDLQVEDKPVPHPQHETKTEYDSSFLKENPPAELISEKVKHLLALTLPAALVVIIGVALVYFISNKNQEEIISEINNQPETEKNRDYLEENEQRIKDLTAIAKEIENFKVEYGAYPSAAQIESVLGVSESWDGLPVDPKSGEKDKVGKIFGYVYAVYDSTYIVSALFEDSKGFGYAWSRGDSVGAHSDYRDIEEENIILIGTDEDTVDGKSDESSDSSENEGSEGPKVKIRK